MKRAWLVIPCGLLLWGCASTSPRDRAGVVAFMSDFSTRDDAVGFCKGVMLGLDPRLNIVDITHQIRPFNIRDAARYLMSTAAYFPKGTVFVTVVDPGVGGERKALVAKSKRGHYYVLPDNGLITFVADTDGLEGAREITEESWMVTGRISSTFHGRDIFAPVAARIARGDDWTKVGPPLAEPVRLKVKAVTTGPRGVAGEVISLDGDYGNVITNIPYEKFAALGYAVGETVGVRIGKKKLTLKVARWFSEVPEGAALLYNDSSRHVALAINMGNFARKHGVVPPASIEIPVKGSR